MHIEKNRSKTADLDEAGHKGEGKLGDRVGRIVKRQVRNGQRGK